MYASCFAFLASIGLCLGQSRTIKAVEGLCGGTFNQSEGRITSPNYPLAYPPNANCTWSINVEDGKKIQIEFEQLNIELGLPNCPFDGVIVVDGAGISLAQFLPGPCPFKDFEHGKAPLVLGKFCDEDKFKPFVSVTNSVIIGFYSNEDIQDSGFVLSWNSIDATHAVLQSCDFEAGLCEGWRNVDTEEDTLDWSITSGETPTMYTGPIFDHTLGNRDGKYAFIETSSPQIGNDTALLTSPQMKFGDKDEEFCMEFWYHMFGQTIGSLVIEIAQGEKRSIEWMRRGDQGDKWQHAKVPIKKISGAFRVVYVGVRGSGYDGNIAIDDVKIHGIPCADIDCKDRIADTTSNFCSGRTTVVQSCDFEDGFCVGWYNVQTAEDTFDWSLISGETTSTRTGPSFDHTLKNKDGTYAFIEASLPRKENDTAILTSPRIKFGDADQEYCLEYWYHMYGELMGSLAIGIMQEKRTSIKWFKKGNQGDEWKHAMVAIEKTAQEFRIVFVGTRGNGFHGDIAIDDVKIYSTPCAEIGLRDKSSCDNDSDYPCINSTICIHEDKICDGIMDCPHKDDENSISCVGSGDDTDGYSDGINYETTGFPDIRFITTDVYLDSTSGFDATDSDVDKNTKSSKAETTASLVEEPTTVWDRTTVPVEETTRMIFETTEIIYETTKEIPDSFATDHQSVSSSSSSTTKSVDTTRLTFLRNLTSRLKPTDSISLSSNREFFTATAAVFSGSGEPAGDISEVSTIEDKQNEEDNSSDPVVMASLLIMFSSIAASMVRLTWSQWRKQNSST